jgi:hypothetical protein
MTGESDSSIVKLLVGWARNIALGVSLALHQCMRLCDRDGGAGREWLAAISLILLWTSLFGIGITIDSKEYRTEIQKGMSLNNLVMVVLTYPYTNAALLCCIAGTIAGIASRIHIKAYLATDSADKPKLYDELSIAYMKEPPVVSMIRSFGVYIIYISGASIGMVGGGGETGAPVTANFQQYIAFAGFVSSCAFAVGYDPSIFTGFLKRFSQKADATPTGAQPPSSGS